MTSSALQPPHRHELRVRWNELDPYGHVNHAVYVTYLEIARTRALDDIGWPMSRVSEAGLHLVVVELGIKYRRAAGLDDDLVIETAMASSKRMTSQWSQRILRGDEVMATATVTVAVTGTDGRPMRPPAWLREALAPLQLDR